MATVTDEDLKNISGRRTGIRSRYHTVFFFLLPYFDEFDFCLRDIPVRHPRIPLFVTAKKLGL